MPREELPLEIETFGAGRPLLFLHGEDYFAQHRPFLDLLARRQPGRRAAPSRVRRHRAALLVSPGRGYRLSLSRSARRRGSSTMCRRRRVVRRLDGARDGVRSTARIGRLALLGSVGVKFSGREQRDFADPCRDVGRGAGAALFADPRRVPDYAAMAAGQLETIARTARRRRSMAGALLAQPGAGALAASGRAADAGALGRGGPVCRALLRRAARRGDPRLALPRPRRRRPLSRRSSRPKPSPRDRASSH